ncbi:hypothetical protein FRC10_010809 [Ceratobasidium sp. 414]|nr:hypothetical protein FRC10_010809 [Ceratobasidium sp. 414]
MQKLIVLHVALVEQATGTEIIEGNDMMDCKEDELWGTEELDEERELLGKVLKKLVKREHEDE